ncbi:hypothetical protein [Entomohabitans teleogrylli]|uniref:hypothetical protein n=1 Tax=Entomohabitans teleogrylli TaxID=1384589 RepID=UPI000AC4B0B8|nr:hypothetical protein [Entomohabitans teleogrylli]
MTIPASNQLTGKISHIADGVVNDEIKLSLRDEGKMSRKETGRVVALIKVSSVPIAVKT